MKDFRFAKVAFASFVLCFVMLFAASSTSAAFQFPIHFVCYGDYTTFPNIDSSKYSAMTFKFSNNEPEELDGLVICTYISSTPTNKKCVTFDGSQNTITMDFEDPTQIYSLRIDKRATGLESISGTYLRTERN
ncbi:hypothetical protein [Marininema halotolerans]|uniref:SbsA Ig-like domain-containing protein n=1 Tax=Marininema halotolerans TaxID=1155944 RepID=A0A1I6U0A9_9BACL|nr:hypothetical protein [Marininema halotolerans]SFS94834.1 hypothetical protein SAMN05444972_11268 [Marininema halotolerans]